MTTTDNQIITTPDVQTHSYLPSNYTDVGQATIFAQVYKDQLCYCSELSWLAYKDGLWTQSETDAHGLA